MEKLDGKVAVVTGAGSGMGRAFAERLAGEGMKVVLADIEPTSLQEVVADIRKSGGEAIGVETDVRSASSVERLAAETVNEFGAAHVLCNNAGVEKGMPFDEIPLSVWEWVIDINLWGVINGCRTFLPLMREQGEGHIVNTASAACFAASQPTLGPYITSKFAVLGLTESLARELKGQGEKIGVSLLAPGPVKTNIVHASEHQGPTDVLTDNPSPTRSEVIGSLSQVIAEVGMEPAEVAEHVVAGIRENRFFILTHPNDAIAAVEQRIDWMKGGETPMPQKLGERLASAGDA